MVEHETCSLEYPKGQAQRPEDVRRIAGLDHGEATGAPGPERSSAPSRETSRRTRRRAELAAAGDRPVLVKLHRVNDLERRIAPALGAHDSDAVTRRDQRLTLQPYPPVEGTGRFWTMIEPRLHVHKSSGRRS